MGGGRAILNRFQDLARTARERLVGLWEDVREAYGEADRYARMRLWVVAFVAVDALCTVGFLWASSGRPALEVWYEVGFPSNMLILRNRDDDPLRGVQILLDGRYGLQAEEIPADSVTGFEIDREFRDREGRTPGAQYRPRTARITRDGKTEVLPLAPVSEP
jgi:hypothetical protein